MKLKYTSEEVEKLWLEYKRTSDAALKEELVKLYLPLVKYIVSKISFNLPSGVDKEDLYGFGVIGLLDAIERYDPKKGYKFETYAVPRIRGAIIDELRKLDWFPRSARTKINKLEDAIYKLTQEKGRVPTDDEIMEYLGIDEKEYRNLLDLVNRSGVLSLDYVLELEEDDVSLFNAIPDETTSSPEEVVLQKSLVEEVANALEKLPEKERLVITLYYYEGLNLKEISYVLGVTESRVSQIHGKALGMLRALLKEADSFNGVQE